MAAGEEDPPERGPEAFDAAQFVALKGLSPPGVRLLASPLTGGYWNQVVRVQGRGLDLVVKRYHAGRGPLRFPNLPEAEAAALKHFAADDPVPAFRAYYPDEADRRPILVYDFAAGRPFEGDPGPVGAALKRLHARTLPEDPHPFRRLAFRARSFLREVDRLLESEPALAEDARMAALLARRPQERPLPRPPALSVIHTDCGPGNLIVGPDGVVVVIDWQCCGAGDPAEDLYAFLSPAFQLLSQREPLHSGERARFLVAYGDAAAEARLEDLRSFYAFRMLAYCAYRHRALEASDPKASARYARAFDVEFPEVFA